MIEERSFEFALKIIPLAKKLKDRKEYVFADQLMRSGTSIGANVAEAGAGQSKTILSRKCQLLPRKLVKQGIG